MPIRADSVPFPTGPERANGAGRDCRAMCQPPRRRTARRLLRWSSAATDAANVQPVGAQPRTGKDRSTSKAPPPIRLWPVCPEQPPLSRMRKPCVLRTRWRKWVGPESDECAGSRRPRAQARRSPVRWKKSTIRTGYGGFFNGHSPAVRSLETASLPMSRSLREALKRASARRSGRFFHPPGSNSPHHPSVGCASNAMDSDSL